MIIERTTWTDEWVKANVPNAATNVMTREQAKTAVFTYISTNYEYSLDILGDLDKERDASDAYSLIANNTGVCIAFSCAFRAMLEAVPFNPSTGLVDWNCVEPDHILVAIVENGKHMWNAIQNAQGTWGFYDTACASKYRESMMAFYDLLGGQVYGCYGEKIWHYYFVLKICYSSSPRLPTNLVEGWFYGSCSISRVHFFLANYPIRHFLTNAPTFPVLIPLSVVQLYLCKGELCFRHTMGKGKL